MLLSDLLQFILPLLLPCADIEGMRERLRRRHKGGELGEKGALMATWVMKEASVNTWYCPTKTSNLWCLFAWSDVKMTFFQKRLNDCPYVSNAEWT